MLTLYLVRALGPGDYGLFALALSIATLLVLASDYGFTGAAGRFIAERRGEPRAVAGVIWDATVLKLAVLVCAGLAALAARSATPTARPSSSGRCARCRWWCSGRACSCCRSVFAALGRVSLMWWAVLLESAFEVSASVLLVVLGAGATGATRPRGRLPVRSAGRRRLHRALRRPAVLRRAQQGHMRGMTGYAGALFVVTVAFTLFEQIDVLLLIGAIISTTAVAIFEAPLRRATFLAYGGMALAMGSARALRAAPARDRTWRRSQAARAICCCSRALLAPLVVWAGPLVDLALGPGYGESAEVLRALTPFVFLSAIGTFITVAVNYLGEARRRVPLAIATVVLNVALDLALLPAVGVIGAAIATDIAFFAYVAGHVDLQAAARPRAAPTRRLARAVRGRRCRHGRRAGALRNVVAVRGEWIAGRRPGLRSLSVSLSSRERYRVRAGARPGARRTPFIADQTR